MITIDRGGPGDVELIMELEGSGFETLDRWSEASWAGEFYAGDRQVSVARAGDGGLIGVVTVQVVGDTADLHRIVVASGSRRQGLATALLDAAEAAARARGARRMLLEVDADNHAARALYTRAGYRDVHRRPGYYRTGGDALVLGKSLREDDDE